MKSDEPNGGNPPATGRRSFLRGAAVVPLVAVGATTVPLAQHAAAQSAPPSQQGTVGTPWKAADYSPNYFNAAEWAFVLAAAARLIPEDDVGPGAIHAGVPEFMDRQMDTDYGHGLRWYLQGPYHPDAEFSLGYQMQYNPRDLYRAAVKELNDWCQQQHKNTFDKLDGDTQDSILHQLEKGDLKLPTIVTKDFFLQLLGNVKEGYFADPMYGGNKNMVGWKLIGFPGARADFADWSKKPNTQYPLGPVSIQGQKG